MLQLHVAIQNEALALLNKLYTGVSTNEVKSKIIRTFIDSLKNKNGKTNVQNIFYPISLLQFILYTIDEVSKKNKQNIWKAWITGKTTMIRRPWQTKLL